MKFTKSLLTVTCSILLSTSIFAWDHIVLKSDSGNVISIDYVTEFKENNCYKCSSYFQAGPVWVNISELAADSNVRVVFINNFKPRTSDQMLTGANPPTVLDLKYVNEGRFTGELKNPSSYSDVYAISANGYGGKLDYFQEIAIVVDGKWLVDPISKSHNFKFRMRE